MTTNIQPAIIIAAKKFEAYINNVKEFTKEDKQNIMNYFNGVSTLPKIYHPFHSETEINLSFKNIITKMGKKLDSDNENLDSFKKNVLENNKHFSNYINSNVNHEEIEKMFFIYKIYYNVNSVLESKN